MPSMRCIINSKYSRGNLYVRVEFSHYFSFGKIRNAGSLLSTLLSDKRGCFVVFVCLR